MDHMPAERCEFIHECIKESINEEGGGVGKGKSYNNKTKMKLADIVCRHFNYKDNQVLLTRLMKGLVQFKFCKFASFNISIVESIDTLKRLELIL